jgi:hypothetical protein
VTFEKFLGEPPQWAEPGNVIGYTFHDVIGDTFLDETLIDIDDYFNQEADRLAKSLRVDSIRRVVRPTKVAKTDPKPWSMPSVYYQQGHATLQHTFFDNLGWTKSDDCQWMFFGNVPKTEAQKDPHDDGGSKGAFLTRMRRDYGRHCTGKGETTSWHEDLEYGDNELAGPSQKTTNPGQAGPSKKPQSVPADSVLLEMWFKCVYQGDYRTDKVAKVNTILTGHGSRNRFRWVGDQRLRGKLDQLAKKVLRDLRRLDVKQLGQ